MTSNVWLSGKRILITACNTWIRKNSIKRLILYWINPKLGFLDHNYMCMIKKSLKKKRSIEHLCYFWPASCLFCFSKFSCFQVFICWLFHYRIRRSIQYQKHAHSLTLAHFYLHAYKDVLNMPNGILLNFYCSIFMSILRKYKKQENTYMGARLSRNKNERGFQFLAYIHSKPWTWVLI